MIDPELDRQYQDCEELLQYWQSFQNYYNMAIKGTGLTPENEEAFIQIKSRIAMLTDSFVDALKDEPQETVVVGNGIQKIVEASITLKILSKMDFATIRKAQLEWNESFILLTDTIGQLKHKREELAKISKTQAASAKIASTISQKTTGFLKSGGFKLAVGGSIAGVVLFFLFYVGLIHYMGDVPPARQLYNLIIDSGYRSVNPDYPWHKLNYLAEPSWHKAQRPLNTPERGGDTMDELLVKFARTGAGQIAAALKGGQMEFKGTTITSKQTGLEQKSAEIYYFRIKDNPTARDIKKAWSELVARNNDVKRSFRLISEQKHLGNIIILVKTSDSDFGNDIYVNVFGNPTE